MALRVNSFYYLKIIFNNREKKSEGKRIYSGVPQGSVLGLLLFLVYINILLDGITSIYKIFADDTSVFWKVLDLNKLVIELNADLENINQWAYQWKMQFNPDPNN